MVMMRVRSIIEIAVYTNTTQWDTALPELEAFIAANTVTQDQVDAYLLALANFNGDLQAQQAEYDDLVADRNTAIALLAAFNARGDVLTRAMSYHWMICTSRHLRSLRCTTPMRSMMMSPRTQAVRSVTGWRSFSLSTRPRTATLMINQAREVTE